MSHENGAASTQIPGQQTLLEDSFENSSSTEASINTTSTVPSDDSDAENYFGNGYPDEADPQIRDLLNLSDKSYCGRNHNESDNEFCEYSPLSHPLNAAPIANSLSSTFAEYINPKSKEGAPN
ncbi:hypothetical protein pipiens_004540 [Culex pipiens pipiens]|uniref:Uncharacterized protein n=1 Tax=Culex pipiens pipiens TaxID=38569 RepID=A0ABD1CJ32_CULPP